MDARWDPCIAHYGSDAATFIAEYFASKEKKVLFIAGAGFDPRASLVASHFKAVGAAVNGILIREDRPDADQTLFTYANSNIDALKTFIANPKIHSVNIFGTDGAVIGGRHLINFFSTTSVDGFTDVVIDISALSVGASFPLIRYFLKRLNDEKKANLHIFVSHSSDLDDKIKPIASDSAGTVHGFRGKLGLDTNARAAKLWLPQLAPGRTSILSRIFETVVPDDTCPILPFPSPRPRLGDELVEQFAVELEDTWEVDPRSLVYAAENDPLDLYRTILRIDDFRKKVFSEIGGSLMILSPVGSKVMALGALLAAIERDLPVVYLEAMGYDFQHMSTGLQVQSELVHVWIEGDAYSPDHGR